MKIANQIYMHAVHLWLAEVEAVPFRGQIFFQILAIHKLFDYQRPAQVVDASAEKAHHIRMRSDAR
jgi:hypothetical protein